jgi:hypothetical protein
VAAVARPSSFSSSWAWPASPRSRLRRGFHRRRGFHDRLGGCLDHGLGGRRNDRLGGCLDHGLGGRRNHGLRSCLDDRLYDRAGSCGFGTGLIGGGAKLIGFLLELGEHLLQGGDVVVAQLDGPLQIRHDTLQLADPAAQFFRLSRLGVGLLAGQHELLLGACGIRLRGGTADSFGALATGYQRQATAVVAGSGLGGRRLLGLRLGLGGRHLGLGRRRRLGGRHAGALRRLWSGCRETLAVLLPGLVLSRDLRQHHLPLGAAELRDIGYAKHGAGAQSVDIRNVECVGIGAEHGQHHALDTHRIVRTIAICQRPEGIPVFDVVGVRQVPQRLHRDRRRGRGRLHGGLGGRRGLGSGLRTGRGRHARLGRRGGLGGRRGCSSRRRRRLYRWRRRRLGRRRLRRGARGRRCRNRLGGGWLLQSSCLDLGQVSLRLGGDGGAVDRRVEEYGVLADDAPARPGHLHQEVQKRLDDGTPGGDVDVSTVGPVLDGAETELGELEWALDAGALELGGAGQLHLHAVEITTLERAEADARAQRLVEGRADLDVAQTQCPDTGRSDQKEERQGASPDPLGHIFHALIKSCPAQLRRLQSDPC